MARQIQEKEIVYLKEILDLKFKLKAMGFFAADSVLSDGLDFMEGPQLEQFKARYSETGGGLSDALIDAACVVTDYFCEDRPQRETEELTDEIVKKTLLSRETAEVIVGAPTGQSIFTEDFILWVEWVPTATCWLVRVIKEDEVRHIKQPERP